MFASTVFIKYEKKKFTANNKNKYPSFSINKIWIIILIIEWVQQKKKQKEGNVANLIWFS